MKNLLNVLPVKEYNRQAEARWHENYSKWNYGQGGEPQLAFYIYQTSKGNYREFGYVASYEYVGSKSKGSVWARTKKEAIAKALN